MRTLLIVTCLAMASACGGGGTDAGVDGGAFDRGLPDIGPDMGRRVDAGPDFGPPDDGPFDAGPDAGPPPCSIFGCDGGEACVKDVCVQTCGADIDFWDTTLAFGITPIANFCRPDVLAREVIFAGATATVYELTANTTASPATFTISSWEVVPGVDPVLSEVGTATATVTEEGALSNANAFLEANGDGDGLVFGYTERQTPFPGEVFDMALPGGAVGTRASTVNVDADWLDDDRIIVSAEGIGTTEDGPGLYVANRTDPELMTKVVNGIGEVQGDVFVGRNFVIVRGINFSRRWPDNEEDGTRAFIMSLSTVINSAVNDVPVEIFDEGNELAVGLFELFDPAGGADDRLESGFQVLNDSQVVIETSIGALNRYEANFRAFIGLDLDEQLALTIGAGFTGAFQAGPNELLLIHDDGLLLVEVPEVEEE